MHHAHIAWLPLLLFGILAVFNVEASPLHAATNVSAINRNAAVCVNDRQWTTSNLDPRDCMTAAMQFNHQEVTSHRLQGFEFVERGTRARTRLPVQQTPRKYTYSELQDL